MWLFETFTTAVSTGTIVHHNAVWRGNDIRMVVWSDIIVPSWLKTYIVVETCGQVLCTFCGKISVNSVVRKRHVNIFAMVQWTLHLGLAIMLTLWEFVQKCKDRAVRTHILLTRTWCRLGNFCSGWCDTKNILPIAKQTATGTPYILATTLPDMIHQIRPPCWRQAVVCSQQWYRAGEDTRLERSKDHRRRCPEKSLEQIIWKLEQYRIFRSVRNPDST